MWALDLHAQLGDEALAFVGEQLRERVGGDALNEGGDSDGADDPGQQLQSGCRTSRCR